MRRRRAVWVRPWLQRRNLLGQYERLMSEIRDEDLPAFKNFVRVEQECFMSCLSGWVTELARRTRGTERPWFKPGPHAVVPCHQHCSTLQIKLPALLFPHPLLPGCIFVLLEALGVQNWIVPYPLDDIFFLLLCQIERSCLFLLPLLWLSVRQIFLKQLRCIDFYELFECLTIFV